MKGKPLPATPEQIARFGHVAAVLRKYMAEQNINTTELNKQLGYVGSNPGAYKWLASKGGPSPKARAKVTALTGIPESELTPRAWLERPALGSRVHRVILPHEEPPVICETRDLLQFNVDSNGIATIKLTAKLKLEDAMPLIQAIVQAGIVMKKD